MTKEFKMPMVAESVVEGEVGKWFVKEGDFVKMDQPLLEVLTDKVNVEIPSPIQGKLSKIVVQEGKIAQVGDVLAIFEEAGEVETEKESKPEPDSTAADVHKPEPARKPEGHKPLAAPAVRRKAREMGIDLALVEGSGPGGRITETDLEKYYSRPSEAPEEPEPPAKPEPVPAPPPEPEPPAPEEKPALPKSKPAGEEERIPFRGIRRTVAKQMVKSRQITVSTLHVDTADVTDLVELRETEKRKASEKGVKLTYLPFFIKAAVAALKAYPIVNSSLEDETEEIILKHYYNIGIAVATDDGLVVPVVKDADTKDIWQLARDIKELADKARSGKLALDDVQGSTFSLTNIGSLSGQISFPIINHPNAATTGIQSITKKPVVRDDRIEIRHVVNLSMAFDHRIFDGAVASQFTSEMIRRLETPALLFWEEG
ncbi:2-oxo acid dehydrogenase subunit E2 [candidate division WOR-3 bacterium]|uniref:Dihydrolipoamide acetyltransferase component of pyruvate dehydrogenase complex n=1 Tax=candidate division WOR-3 bacterium TaxID=2052148 RepID=A0A9D5QCA8_UNCW3|nr:2-oxo acid dehydrogenase subunit E2 [candidate division WOR-3 bacterium]MBD3363837.1 2-oxo acid dehydrogenase subunit E2 [candidate division WOR-3 bacterium]